MMLGQNKERPNGNRWIHMLIVFKPQLLLLSRAESLLAAGIYRPWCASDTFDAKDFLQRLEAGTKYKRFPYCMLFICDWF